MERNMKFEVYDRCPKCEGYGSLEHQIAVDEFKDSNCPECDGSGLVMYYEFYDHRSEAVQDYPNARYIIPQNEQTSAWNDEKAIQRGKTIARELLGRGRGS
jgi:hypothetical protein|tara:strand:- start:10 stop:312 length:303 start_codon:yes stop_codon:yes gene_type:complete